MSPALTASDVAKLLGVHRTTVARWTATGKLPVWFVADSGRPVYHADVLDAHRRRVGELAAEAAA